MIERSKDLFKIVAVSALLILLTQSVGAGFGGGCICYYSGDCIYDEQGGMYQYSQCTGSCYAYSGYKFNPKCSQKRTDDSKVYDKIELV